MASDRVLAWCTIARAGSMKASGSTIIGMAGESNVIPTAISTRANSKITSHTAKVSTFGSMGRSTRASGSMDSKRAKESGKASLVTPISASGSSPKRMGTVCTSGRTEIDMRASGNSV